MAVDLGIIENLRKLRKKFSGDREDEKLIDEWEVRLHELSALDDFVRLPTTQHIVKRIKENITSIIRERALKKGLTSETIKDYDIRREENEKILAWFTPNFTEEIAMLEKKIVDGLAP